jgi:hypothetical protein
MSVLNYTADVANAVLDFLEKYNGAVTAIATIFIAAFTIVLARVTGKQARLTTDAISLDKSSSRITGRESSCGISKARLRTRKGIGISGSRL